MIDPNFDNDFQDFSKDSPSNPSQEMEQKLLKKVELELNPKHSTIFIKLISIQAFIGLLTLLFCPQFSLSLTNNQEVFHYFHHRYGVAICMAICGSIFVGSGSIFAAYILSFNEVQKIRSTKTLYFLSVSILLISSFFLLGAEIYLGIAAYWTLGASATGVILFELNSLIKTKILMNV
jgi:hypothetical protein